MLILYCCNINVIKISTTCYFLVLNCTHFTQVLFVQCEVTFSVRHFSRHNCTDVDLFPYLPFTLNSDLNVFTHLTAEEIHVITGYHDLPIRESKGPFPTTLYYLNLTDFIKLCLATDFKSLRIPNIVFEFETKHLQPAIKNYYGRD